MNLGLVLEGGGVKGAFEAGVLKVLDDNGVKFDGVTGTSIGAVNGALYAQESGISSLLDVWHEMSDGSALSDYDRIVQPLLDHNITLDNVVDVGKRMIKLRAFLSETAVKAENFLRKYIDENKLRSSATDFGLVTYNLSNFEPREVMRDDIPDGQLVDYIVASATYPLFPPKMIDGKQYVDGGVYDGMPVKLLAAHGAKRIVTIRTNLPKKHRHTGSKVADDINVYYILPPEDLGWAMLFSSENAKRLYRIGQDVAMRELDGGLRQFISQ